MAGMTQSTAAFVSMVLAGAGAALGQGGWTVTPLNPTGSTRGQAVNVFGGQQVGAITPVGGSNDHASVWSGTAGSWVDLNPGGTGSIGGANSSFIYGTSGGQQAGYAVIFGISPIPVAHAGYWHGTQASWVDLSGLFSSSGINSYAFGTSGTQQVGSVALGSFNRGHAALWSGEAESYVDLHPEGASASQAKGTNGSQQVGFASFFENNVEVSHACVWSGTIASRVDLSPAGSTSSEANAISGTQQVGRAVFGGNYHVGLWNGTAASWVDLTPPGVTVGNIFATCGTAQAGVVGIGTVSHASLWSGTAGSWEDLALALPGGAGAWSGSNASGVWTDGSTLSVVGSAIRISDGAIIALLWTRPVPPPPPPCAPDFNHSGSLDVQDIFDFLAAWFANAPGADFNGVNGTSVQDIFDFLAAWFAGCH